MNFFNKNKFILLILFICFQPVFSQFNPENQREFVILSAHPNPDLNPHTASYNSEIQIINGLYEGLFSYDPLTLQPVPAICDTYKLSRDKKTWTFTLKENVMFSDGTKITAQNVLDSWIKLLKNPNAPFASLFDIVCGATDFKNGKITEEELGIKVKDEKTISVKLLNPAEHFINILCTQAFSVVNNDENCFSGAFVLKEYQQDYIILEKNQNYWDAQNVALPSIKIFISNNEEENTFLYNTGKVDWAMDMLTIKKVLKPQTIFLSTQFGTEYFFFKPLEEPWNNPTLRIALLSAIPWNEFQEKSLVKATNFIVPVADYPQIFGVPEYDLDSALELKKQAGFENQTLSLICAIQDSEYSMELAKKLKSYWEKIGVELIIQKTPANRYLKSIPGWNAQLFTYSWVGDFADPVAFLELFRGDSSLNVSGWKDETFDNLLLQSATLSGQDRFKKLSEAEQYLLDQGMIIPISHSVSLNVIDTSYVKGWFENALNFHPLKYIYLEKEMSFPNIVKIN